MGYGHLRVDYSQNAIPFKRYSFNRPERVACPIILEDMLPVNRMGQFNFILRPIKGISIFPTQPSGGNIDEAGARIYQRSALIHEIGMSQGSA